MEERLQIVICEHYVREVDTILQQPYFAECSYRIVAADCMRHAPQEQPCLQEDTTKTVYLIGDICRKRYGWHNDRKLVYDSITSCLHLFANNDYIAYLGQQGNYLLTPGWLADWRGKLAQWGFQQDSARKFFREFARQLLLLDTGVDATAGEKLRSLGEYVDMPYQIVPIGLTVFASILENIFLRWKLLNQQRHNQHKLQEIDQKMANNALLYGALSHIAAIDSEQEVIRSIMDTLVMLCAPGECCYVPVVDSQPGEVYAPTGECSIGAEEMRYVLTIDAPYAWTEAAHGFYVRISYQNQTVGVIKLANFAFPEHKHEYVNIACTIVDVCGLAIDNARKYQALEQARQQTIKAREAAVSANKAKSEFLSRMSHELRTPLNGILGYTQILKNCRELQSHFNALEVIDSSGQHLLNLINEILDLSKIEARKFTVDNMAINLRQTLENIVKIVEVRSQQQDIALQRDFSPDLPATVYGDEKKLTQILLNLLNNALKFTRHGSVTLQVRQASEHRDWYVVDFAVEDTGIGIAQEHLAAIFKPFEQVGEQTQTQEGTGLGLTISRHLVQILGGELRVASTMGVGSKFYFQLPFAKVGAPHPIKTKPQQKIVCYRGQRKTILVVDDKEQNRSLLVNLLAPLGFKILEAQNGAQGLEIALADKPDLILTDLIMPKMDGFEMCRRIRSSQTPSHIVIIAVSASTTPIREIVHEHSFDEFMAKPIHLDQLFEMIAKQLDIQWIYQPFPQEKTVPAAKENIVAPELADLHKMHLFARKGDIAELRKLLARLQENERYRQFAHQFCRLTDTFQIKKIRKLIQKYIEECHEQS